MYLLAPMHVQRHRILNYKQAVAIWIPSVAHFPIDYWVCILNKKILAS